MRRTIQLGTDNFHAAAAYAAITIMDMNMTMNLIVAAMTNSLRIK
ncbi:hypothetical protein [Neobacillus notoginsengisoli]|nr:hypothetical protein [Neobacillus notoginsengisoli]